MAFNPQYDQVGKAFTQQYYALFDNPATRGNLQALYHYFDNETFELLNEKLELYETMNNLYLIPQPSDSLMSFEGQQCQGAQKIVEKFAGLTFQKILHVITEVDCQPMFDGGILINVTGQLKTDDDPPHSFSQTFVLKSSEGGFFCQHDIFRLSIHNN